MNVRGILLAVAVLDAALDAAATDAEGPARQPNSGLLAQAMAGPMKNVHQIVFAVRLGYDDPHWYANIGYYCDDEHHKAYAGNGKPDVGKLCKLDLRTGKLSVLLDARGGSVRDPEVHYDAQKVLFAYRPSGSDWYNLYEIYLDGTGLNQITSGEFDDYEPAYLPDGGIVFVSTRCRCWVNCWMTQVGVLYRCDADGRNIRRLSYSGEHDNTPSVLPDGRVLYTRWEYVDRSQVEFHHLWTMNPDGTAQTIFYGNMHPGTVMIDAKPIPRTNKVVASFSPGHGVNDHKGIATIVSPQYGPDYRPAARPIHTRPLVKDPYPLSEDCFLLARGKQLLVMDGSGKAEVIYTHPGEGEIHEPRPVLARNREPVIPSRVDWNKPSGRLVLTDVYRGRNMQGVRRGEIKKLLVLEILPKQVNFSGGPDLVSWLGTFTLERVLGTVPVEPDGSACFDVPACRPVFFVALDEHDLSVKRMHSFTTVMPGEVAGCVGCHEPRTTTPGPLEPAQLQALRRPPDAIQPFEGFPDVLDFPRDIQPILDRHCVRCHNYAERGGHVILTGDLGPHWSHSFFSLFAHRQVADGRNGLGNHPPRTIGSSASPLLKKLEPGHYDVNVSPQEWRTVWLWTESGAPYAGSYAALRNAEDQARASAAVARVFHGLRELLVRRCSQCHVTNDPSSEQGRPLPFHPRSGGYNRGVNRPVAVYERIVLENDPVARLSENILLNFTRPHLSPLILGPLARQSGGFGSCGPVFQDTKDPDYQRLLAAIQQAKAELDAAPRYATPGFQPNRQYVREMKRYGILPASFDPANDRLDVFQTDQAYWKSFWHLPPPGE
ncbi:MAG: HzsA-related protein [Thermoguttaceae bacterium]